VRKININSSADNGCRQGRTERDQLEGQTMAIRCVVLKGGHTVYEKISANKEYFRLLLLLVIGSLWVLSCSSKSKQDNPKDLREYAEQFGIIIPDRTLYAPNFRLENLQGEEVALDNFRGKIVFLHFSTTW